MWKWVSYACLLRVLGVWTTQSCEITFSKRQHRVATGVEKDDAALPRQRANASALTPSHGLLHHPARLGAATPQLFSVGVRHYLPWRSLYPAPSFRSLPRPGQSISRCVHDLTGDPHVWRPTPPCARSKDRSRSPCTAGRVHADAVATHAINGHQITSQPVRNLLLMVTLCK